MQHGERGFTYLLLLFAVAAMGLTLAGAGQVWQTVSQRDKEDELLFVGNQFRLAIASYHVNTPGATKQYPANLEELVEDRRFPTPRRHLRRVYRDPMTGSLEWGEVKSAGRIVAVHSKSSAPVLRSVFDQRDAGLEGTAQYDQWVFGPATGAVVVDQAPGTQGGRP